MSLIMFRLISSDMRVHIESFKMITIDNPSNRILNIGPSIWFKCSFIKIILIFGIREWSSIRFKFFYIFFNLIPSFLFLFCLLSQLVFSYSCSYLGILVILFSFLFGYTYWFSSLLAFGVVIIDCGCFFYFYCLGNGLTFHWVWTIILVLVEGNILFLLVGCFLLILFCFWGLGYLFDVLLIMGLCLVNSLPW